MLEDAKAEEGLVDAEGNPTAEGIRQIQKRSASQSDAVQADLDRTVLNPRQIFISENPSLSAFFAYQL